jgi:hypothetical protein
MFWRRYPICDSAAGLCEMNKNPDSHHLNSSQMTVSKLKFDVKNMVTRKRGGPSTTRDFAAAEPERICLETRRWRATWVDWEKDSNPFPCWKSQFSNAEGTRPSGVQILLRSPATLLWLDLPDSF